MRRRGAKLRARLSFPVAPGNSLMELSTVFTSMQMTPKIQRSESVA
jgi:hypothetical protein